MVAFSPQQAVVLSLRNRPGDKVEEEQLERLTLERRRQVFGDAHLETAQSLNNLAVFHLQREGPGDLETATTLFTEALAIRESELGADHPWVANTRNNLANVLLANGRPLEAETLFRRAIDGWSVSLGPEHVRVATGWWGLSRALEELGDLRGHSCQVNLPKNWAISRVHSKRPAGPPRSTPRRAPSVIRTSRLARPASRSWRGLSPKPGWPGGER